MRMPFSLNESTATQGAVDAYRDFQPPSPVRWLSGDATSMSVHIARALHRYCQACFSFVTAPAVVVTDERKIISSSAVPAGSAAVARTVR